MTLVEPFLFNDTILKMDRIRKDIISHLCERERERINV